MSENPPTSPPPADPQACVERLIRIHNLWILVVFIGAAACLALAQARGSLKLSDTVRLWLNIGRIAAPLLALLVTALMTNSFVTKTLAAVGEREVTIDDVIGDFSRSRMIGMALLGVTGLLADLSLVISSRVIDALLALVALGLLVNFRPRLKALLSFAVTVESLHRDARDGKT